MPRCALVFKKYAFGKPGKRIVRIWGHWLMGHSGKTWVKSIVMRLSLAVFLRKYIDFGRDMFLFPLLSFSIALVLTFTTTLVFLSSFLVHFPADSRGNQHHKQRESAVHCDAEYSSASKIILCNAYLFLWIQKIQTLAARHKTNFNNVSLHSTWIEDVSNRKYRRNSNLTPLFYPSHSDSHEKIYVLEEFFCPTHHRILVLWALRFAVRWLQMPL